MRPSQLEHIAKEGLHFLVTKINDGQKIHYDVFCSYGTLGAARSIIRPPKYFAHTREATLLFIQQQLHKYNKAHGEIEYFVRVHTKESDGQTGRDITESLRFMEELSYAKP